MSIRAKILAGCLSLTLVTLVVGWLDLAAQARMGQLALRLYDDAFLSMSHLRSAQNTMLEMSHEWAEPSGNHVAAQLESVAGDLRVAHARAMSPEGRTATAALINDLDGMMTGRAAPSGGLPALLSRIDDAVELFAGDGYAARRATVRIARETRTRTCLALALSVVVALGITALLSRAIVPSLRRAVQVATAIADGKTDNVIEPRARPGRSETKLLLHALGTMQASISHNMERIQNLLAEQASNHAVEIAAHDLRFAAALDNMSQGLCMFDAAGRVSVANRRFGEMFGVPEEGAGAHLVLPPALVGVGDDGAVRTLDDGRIVAVGRRDLPDGGWVSTYEDLTERHRAEARLAHVARHDTLTGLPNRILYREHMEHALAQARRGSGLGVLCIDLDDFKQANDLLGHGVGDALLKEAARRLVEISRETDVVFRVGGDEFAVVQSASVQPTAAKALADRLIAAMGRPFEVMGHTVNLGASIGIAISGDGLTTGENLLKCADLALYRARADGRGTYRFFEATMDASMRARRTLEQDLRRAVAAEEFEVYYQPLVETLTGKVCGFEGLVRWRHPERGLVSPGDFIPLAEEIGLIPSIGRLVLTRACHEAVGWPGDLKVAVNLSPLQFRNRDLAHEVAGVLEASGLEASRLELEITESLLLQESEATFATLHRLRGLGVRIAMDDFGTGYSSLSYLRRFPFDKIKIDQSFVRNLGERGECLAIVRAVVGLGAALGIRVTAEGVETEEQYGLLKLEGCHQVQGYLFSRPAPASQVAGLIGRLVEAA